MIDMYVVCQVVIQAVYSSIPSRFIRVVFRSCAK